MRRKLFTLAAGASAVLCVAACVLWVRSYWVADHFRGPATAWGQLLGGSSRGTIGLTGIHPMPPEPWEAARARQRRATHPIRTWTTAAPYSFGVRRPLAGEPGVRWSISFLRFGLFRTDGGTAPPGTTPSLIPGTRSGTATFARAWNVTVPHWFPVMLFAAVPSVRFRPRRRRRPVGLCPACGYDLRATPDRCPECGAVPAKGAA